MSFSPYDFVEKDVRPRICNTGAERTVENALIAVVDWVQVTLKIEKQYKDLERVMFYLSDFFDTYNFEFTRINGNYGYQDCLRSDGISIYFNGPLDMGIYLQITGKGCRLLESDNNFNWQSFFLFLDKIGIIAISRLDVAIDDFKGYFTIQEIINKVKRAELSSRFRTSRNINSTDISTGDNKGNTIYFGSPQSMLMFRFYEKDKEREKHNEYYNIDVWNRYEIQTRNERSFNLFEIIKNDGDLGIVIQGILSYYMRFLTRGKDSNKRRWRTWHKWEKFIKDVEKIKLTSVTIENDIYKKIDWAKSQLARTLAQIHEFDPDIIDDILKIGKNKLTEKDINHIKIEKKRATKTLVAGENI